VEQFSPRVLRVALRVLSSVAAGTYAAT